MRKPSASSLPTGTAKSMWALIKAAALSRAGVDVAYFSEENPTTEDLRRLALGLRPDAPSTSGVIPRVVQRFEIH